MNRHGSIAYGPILVLSLLLVCLAFAAVWPGARPDSLQQPTDEKHAGADSTGIRGAADPAGYRVGDPNRPRLFLARDRVRRLPPVHDRPEHLTGVSFPLAVPDETLAGAESEHSRDGPSLATPPATIPPVEAPPRRAVLEPPKVQFVEAMPACPELGGSALPLDPPAQVSSPRLAPAVGPPEPYHPQQEPVVSKSVEIPEIDAADAPGPRGVSTAKVREERSEAMEQIAREADRHTRRGFELAGRNAMFAARSQFVVALRLLAQGLDTDHGAGSHSRALAEGLDAIQEADDFIPRGARVEADLDLAVIIRGHRTPVLKQTELDRLTPMAALKAYFTFAQERLAAAAANEVAGSMALHGLGKLHAALARNPAIDLAAAEPKAVAFFQAALLVYPRNLMAANDLGVLLARAGHWKGARQVLEHAVAVNPQSVSWRNLAVVYQQLGNMSMARHARQMADAAIRQEIARRGGSRRFDKVQWLAPGEFAETHVHSRMRPAPRVGQVSAGSRGSERR